MITRILLFFMLSTSFASANDLMTGRPVVLDGDTIKINQEKIRLFGIDAPEWKQTCKNHRNRTFSCGQVAAYALAKYIGTSQVTCQLLYRDAFRRWVGLCKTRNKDIGHFMVSQGYAVDFARYSKGHYQKAEKKARNKRLGFWSGEFAEPSVFRKMNKR